jgi:hypothetical protein
MKILGMFVTIAIFSIFTGVIEAAMLSKLWAWFVAAEYGSGPSYGAWFGISMILGTIVQTATPMRSPSGKETDDLDDLIKKMVGKQIGLWFGCFMSLALAWVTGAAMGWLR